MTLSQRLTRAGAAFVIFGFAAALLPQQNEATKAAVNSGTCPSPPPLLYRLTTNNAPNFPATASASITHKLPATIYAAASTDGIHYTAATASYQYTGTNVMIFPSSGTATTLTVHDNSGKGDGTFALVGTFTGNNTTKIVSYPIVVSK